MNHCQQIQALKVLMKGFFSAKFDRIIDLDKEAAKMTAESFFETILEPALDKLKEMGVRMEDGLTVRKSVMGITNNYLEFKGFDGEGFMVKGKENLEEYYQREKEKLKETLRNKRKTV